MVVFMLLSFVLLFILFNKNKNKFSALLMSISFSFLFLYAITEILSLFDMITENTIVISWIVYDLVLLILGIIKLYKNKFKFIFNYKDILKKIDYIHIVILFVMICLVVISMKTVPYNWDSMTYHLPRIMHWIQNGSINHYATNIVRQITSPSFAEISNMHVYLLSGSSDIYVNLLQTFSFIVNTFIVYFIAKKLGCDKKFSILAMILALSMPIGIAEALTTQVDNFAALWCLIFTYFILDFLDKKEKLQINKENILKLMCLGISLGFGYLTKPTVLFSDALFTLYLFIVCIIRKDRLAYVIKSVLIVLIITIIITAPNVIRNIKTFNAISDPIAGSKQMIHTDKKSYFAINFIKNLLWNYPTFIINENDVAIMDYVEELAEKHNVPINDESISEGGFAYAIEKGIIYHHDYAINPLIMWSLTGTIALYIVYAINNKFKCGNTSLYYCVITVLAFLIFMAVMRFQIWSTRYEISFLTLLCPTISILLSTALDKSNYKYYFIGAISCLAFISIVNQFNYHEKKTKIENNDRTANYFNSNKGLYNSYLEITNIINEKGYTNIGIEITEDTYEYPFYIMINNIDRLEHINVNNSTNIYYDENYVPDVVISRISHEDSQIYNNNKYNKIYDLEKYSVYELIK